MTAPAQRVDSPPRQPRSDDAARAEQADQLSALDRDLFEKREHQRTAAMFTSLRLTQGRPKRELHAVKAPNLSGGQQLSKLLGQGPVYAAGAYDGVSAKLVESSGFKAVYVPGSAVSASVLGQPDLGYIGLAEMAEAVRRITSATSIASESPEKLREAFLSVDGDDVDALIQCGTNLECVATAAALEKEIGKPVIAINVATAWHAFRVNGIEDRISGYGRLLEEHRGFARYPGIVVRPRLLSITGAAKGECDD